MRAVVVAIIVAVVAAVCAVAWANIPNGWHPASFDVSGYHVLKFRVPAAGLTPAQRRLILEYRMPKVLTYVEWRREVSITDKPAPRGGRAIYVNGKYFVTVTREDAKANIPLQVSST